MNLKYILVELCLPVISFLAMCISVPYAFVQGIVPLFGKLKMNLKSISDLMHAKLS